MLHRLRSCSNTKGRLLVTRGSNANQLVNNTLNIRHLREAFTIRNHELWLLDQGAEAVDLVEIEFEKSCWQFRISVNDIDSAITLYVESTVINRILEGISTRWCTQRIEEWCEGVEDIWKRRYWIKKLLCEDLS